MKTSCPSYMASIDDRCSGLRDMRHLQLFESVGDCIREGRTSERWRHNGKRYLR